MRQSGQTDYGDYDLTSYDTSAVGWGATASSAWYEVIKRDFIAGEYVWTGFDYYGEPSPFGWPGISSQFGICDLGGLPKDYYYYYQANWTKKPMIHIMPHWNKKGLEIINGQTKV